MRRLLLVVGALCAPLAGAAQSVSELAYPLRTDWSSSDSHTNISMFIFNDVNANGDYDLGDRPMTSVIVGLRRGAEGLAAKHSNTNGFANFKASTTKEDALINAPGTYDFQAIVPPGWRGTTGNEAQQLTFTALPGSITGLGLEEMMRPVGVTQIRTLSGRHPAGAGVEISVRRDGSEVGRTVTDVQGRFVLQVNPGTYDLVGGDLRRGVQVGEAPVQIGLLANRPDTNTAQTLTFDTATRAGVFKIPNGYGGLDWFNLNIIRRDTEVPSHGYVNSNTSHPYLVYTSSGIAGEISRDVPFVFDGVMLGVAWRKAHGETAVIEAWNGDDKVLEDEVTLSVLGPVNYQPAAGPVTRIRFSTRHQWQMVFDDFRFAEISN